MWSIFRTLTLNPNSIYLFETDFVGVLLRLVSLHVVLKWVLAICFCNLTDHWNQMFFLGKSASNHINRTSIWWSGCTSLGVWYVILLAFDNCLLFLLQITITANISEHALGTGLHPKGFIYIIPHNSNPKAPWSSYFNYFHVMTNKGSERLKIK